MSDTNELNSVFEQFADRNGQYYSDTFLKLQQSKIGKLHINWAAALGSFVWAAMRSSWLLFWIGFLIDLLAIVHLAHYFKFDWALAQAVVDGKENLISRYGAWSISHLWWAIGVFVIGRLSFGWLADRLYFRHYNSWRVGKTKRSGFAISRLIWAVVIAALVMPLLTYRASQFAPSQRDCLKLSREIAKGEETAFKARFDCATISDFPRLFQLQRPNQVDYKRADDGSRELVVKPPKTDKPINLHDWTATIIENGITRLKAAFGGVFDTIADSLRTLLGAITALFAETPWPIVMAAFAAVSYWLAGPRVTILVVVSLAYLALFGFWKIAMDTVSMTVAATLVSIAGGLPIGIWMAKTRTVQQIVSPVLDLMQTIPSFVYLVPAVAFFSVGKPPALIATVIFAMPPMVRLTYLGIQQVPETTKEAALAFGANPRQLMTKVELPLAMPSIMTGVNQVIMMSLSMAVVAALIGGKGLGFLVVRALSEVKTGKGVLAGLGIALIAIMIDRVIQKANQRKG